MRKMTGEKQSIIITFREGDGCHSRNPIQEVAYVGHVLVGVGEEWDGIWQRRGLSFPILVRLSNKERG